MSVVPFSRRPVDWLFTIYFILHIPITLCCDIQIIFPGQYFPQFLQNAMADWIKDYDDVLSGTKPLWFRSFVVAEFLFHVPYFFFAAYAFIKGKNWIRTITIVYASSVITTMIAILPEAWTLSHAPLNTKLALISIYGIWLLLPVLLLKRVWNERVFDYETESSKATGKKKQ